MASVRVQRRLLKWGNAFGIRLTREEARRLGAREKQTVDVSVRTQPEPLDPDDLPVLHLGRDAAKRHDQIIGEGVSADG